MIRNRNLRRVNAGFDYREARKEREKKTGNFRQDKQD